MSTGIRPVRPSQNRPNLLRRFTELLKEKIMVKDPVCGMEIDEKTAAGKSEYQGQIYYFCSTGCKKAFDKEPQKYVKGSSHSEHHGHS
jgi:YHS domain-containing protein